MATRINLLLSILLEEGKNERKAEIRCRRRGKETREEIEIQRD